MMRICQIPFLLHSVHEDSFSSSICFGIIILSGKWMEGKGSFRNSFCLSNEFFRSYSCESCESWFWYEYRKEHKVPMVVLHFCESFWTVDVGVVVLLWFRQPLNAYFVLEACLEVRFGIGKSFASCFRLSPPTTRWRLGFRLFSFSPSQVFVRP